MTDKLSKWPLSSPSKVTMASLCFCFSVISSLKSNISLCFMFFLLCFSMWVFLLLVCLKFACHTLTEMLEKDSSNRHLNLSKDLEADITKFNILSTTLKTYQHMVGLAILKTTYSRYKRTPENIFSRRWIKLKIVAFTSLLTSTIYGRN